jgi:hypothetical protein
LTTKKHSGGSRYFFSEVIMPPSTSLGRELAAAAEAAAPEAEAAPEATDAEEAAPVESSEAAAEVLNSTSDVASSDVASNEAGAA